MNKIEKQNVINALVTRCIDEMRKVGNDNVPAHKAILDRYEAQIKPLGLTRTDFMVQIGYKTGALKNYREIYG